MSSIFDLYIKGVYNTIDDNIENLMVFLWYGYKGGNIIG